MSNPLIDEDSESACLSSMFRGQAARDAAFAGLKSEHFAASLHRATFDGLLATTNAGDEPTVENVAAWLHREKRLERIGGVAALHAIRNSFNSTIAVDAIVRQVRDLGRLREAVTVAKSIEAEATAATTDPQTFLDRASTQYANLAESGRSSTMTPMAAAVASAFNSLHKAHSATGNGLVGQPTGWDTIDQLTQGWQNAEQYVIAGRPGSGKTAFMMLASCASAAIIGTNVKTCKPDGTNVVAVFSLEMGLDALVKRTIACDARVDFNKLRGGKLNDEEWKRVVAAGNDLSTLPLFIDDFGGAKATPMDIRAKARKLAAESARLGKRLSLIAIDYLQLLNGRGLIGPKDSREREVAECSAFCKRLAKELNVPILLLAQLNRPPKTTGCPPPPQLENLRESGGIEQDADAVIFIHREEYYLRDKTPHDKKGKASIIMAKQRNGPTGVVTMNFDGRFVLFTDEPKEYT